MRERTRSPVACGARVALAAALCAACGTHVTFLPVDDDWEPRDRRATALLRSGGAEVRVHLTAKDGAFPLAGAVENRGAEDLRVTFHPERDVPDDTVIGQVLGAGAPETLFAGGGFDLGPAAEGEPRLREFVLQADEPWPESGLPRIGLTASYVVLVRSSAGETRVPLRFRVASARSLAPAAPDWEQGLRAIGLAEPETEEKP